MEEYADLEGKGWGLPMGLWRSVVITGSCTEFSKPDLDLDDLVLARE